jgi:hypothetical protein
LQVVIQATVFQARGAQGLASETQPARGSYA